MVLVVSIVLSFVFAAFVFVCISLFVLFGVFQIFISILAIAWSLNAGNNSDD